MTYRNRQKKVSGFTKYNSVELNDRSSGLKNGGNATWPIQAVIDKVAEVFGGSFRVYEFESELIASDIQLGEYALVEENDYRFYKVTNVAPTGNDLSLTSGYTAEYLTTIIPDAQDVGLNINGSDTDVETYLQSQTSDFESMAALGAASPDTDVVYVKSFYPGWAATLEGPKGGHHRYLDATDTGTPGTYVDGVQYDADGNGWIVSAETLMPAYFGADTTGVNPASDAILDMLAHGVKDIDFGDSTNTYLIDKEIIIDNIDGIKIRGAATLKADTTVTQSSQITGLTDAGVITVYQSDKVDIDGITIDGSGCTGTSKLIGIHYYSSSKKGKIFGNKVLNMPGDGIHIYDQCDDTEIDSNYVFNVGTGGVSGDGILVHARTDGCKVRDNTVDTCRVIGIELEGRIGGGDTNLQVCNDTQITGNTISNCTDKGIFANWSHTGNISGNIIKTSQGIVFIGCHHFSCHENEFEEPKFCYIIGKEGFTNSTTSTFIDIKGGSMNYTGVTADGRYPQGVTGHAWVYLRDCKNITINDFSIHQENFIASTHGVYIDSDTHDITIDGVKIPEGYGPIYGITIEDNDATSSQSQYDIVNNKIDSVNFGLYFVSGNNIDRLNVSRNVIKDYSSTGWVCNMGTITDCTIHDNNFDSSGTFDIDFSSTAFTKCDMLGNTLTVIQNDKANIIKNANIGIANYRTNTGSPVGAVTPLYVGEELLDSSGNAWYKAYGTANTQWQAL